MAIINSIDITAWSTVILAIITFVYVILTHNILKEQRKSIKIAALERKLEKVYSPLVEAKTGLNFGNLGGAYMGVPTNETIIRAYMEFAKKLSKVSENYGHLLDQDIIQNYSKLWNMTCDDSLMIGYVGSREEYDILIEDFNKDVMARKNKYKIELDKLEGDY